VVYTRYTRVYHSRLWYSLLFNGTKRRAQFSVIGYLCSVLLGVVVHAGCDKQDSLMDGGLCSKLYGKPSQLLFALHQSSIRYPYVRRESRFLPTPPAFDAAVGGGGSRWNIAVVFDLEKLEWCGYRTEKKDMFICFDRIHERDRQTERWTDRRTDGQTPHDGICCVHAMHRS